MAGKRVLAFDFGASSGRAILADYDGGRINMREIHRFSNDPVNVRGTLYWDVLRLFFEIKQGITKAVHQGGFDAVGIDTWGVDFGLLDREGQLLANPVHYRDERTNGMMEEAFAVIPREELYDRTGIQLLKFNTLFQLYSLTKRDPGLLARAETMLLMPDLFAYFLTGVKRAEYTEVSTTQMLDPRTGDWARDILERLGIPTGILPDIIDPGQVYGELSDAICEELGCPKVPVIAVATHDTGSAVASVPTREKDFIYLSCGTWCLFGTELDTPLITEETRRFNLTNEGGVGRTTRMLKNIMGLWLTQEARRQWIREGYEVSYADLEREALEVPPFRCFIDPDDPTFETPGNLPRRVREFCERTGQEIPRSRGEIMRCIYESLAMKYRYTFEAVRKATGREYAAIHMIGGGTKDRLLCQMTADACDCRVVAGPIEATAMGNIAVQLMALGEIDSLEEARAIVARSDVPQFYAPAAAAAYEAQAARFARLLEQGGNT